MSNPVDPLREALLRLTDAIDGERRDWHTVEVRPYDLVLVMGSAMHRLDADSPAVPPEGLDGYQQGYDAGYAAAVHRETFGGTYVSDTGEGEKRGACVQAGLSWCSTHNRTFIEGQPHCRAFA